MSNLVPPPAQLSASTSYGEATRLIQQMAAATRFGRIGVWKCDLLNQTLTWDDEMCSIFGVNPNEFTGQLSFFFDRVYPKDLPRVQAGFEALLQGNTDTIEFRIVRPDGALRVIAANGQRVFDRDSSVIAVIGINRDITELQQLEENIRHQVRKLEALVHSVGEIVYEHRIDDDSILCAGVEHFGYCPLSFGTTFSDWLARVHPDDLHLVMKGHQKLSIIGAEYSDIRYRFQTATGRFRWVSDRGVPLYENGELTSIVGILEDVEEQAVKEAALEAARESENRANRSKLLFFSSMNHELRTPMHGVLGFLDLLSSSELNETQRGQVTTAKRCAQSLFSLLNGLMEFTKLDSTPLEVLREKVSVATLFDDCIAAVQLEIAQQSLTIERLITPRVPATILGDAPKLRQVLGHLLANAIRGAPSGSTIHLQARVQQEDKNYLILSVTDRGPGVPAGEYAAATTVLEMGRPGPRGSMSQLGLAIAARLIQSLNGELTIETGATMGATVSVTIPLEVPDAPELPATRENLRVLLVEDTDWSREFIQDCLRRAGIAVDAAADGSEAHGMFRPFHHNTVIINTGIPDGSYLTLVSEFRDLTPTKTLRVIGLGTVLPTSTALKDPPLPISYLDRPVTKDALLELLLSSS